MTVYVCACNKKMSKGGRRKKESDMAPKLEKPWAGIEPATSTSLGECRPDVDDKDDDAEKSLPR